MIKAPLHDLLGVPQGGSARYVPTADGTNIRVAYWQGGERGTVLLFPGRTEYIEKYGRMVAKLQARGLNVVVLDWRGQGLSDRPDNRTDRGHVDHFHDYQQDVSAALSIPEIAELAGPRLLFGHSMGGCIGLRTLVDGLDLEAAVFSSPMWGLPGQKAAKHLLAVVNILGRPFGQHKNLVPGTKPGFYVSNFGFEGNELTNDADHYAMFRQHIAALPDLGLGGPTIHWAVEALREMDALFVADAPDVPVLTFLGTEENVVSAETIEKRVPRLPNGQLQVIDGGKHEIWMETPKIQSDVWDITDQFLDKIL